SRIPCRDPSSPARGAGCGCRCRCRNRAVFWRLCRCALASDDISLAIPLEMVLVAEIAAGPGIDVFLARGFVGGFDGVLDRGRLLAPFVEIAAAARRHRALHRLLIEDREPLAIEVAGDAPPVTVAAE